MTIQDAWKTKGHDIVGTLANGLKGFRDEIKSNDELFYQPLANVNLNATVSKAGEIFLGCIPLCFYGLTYLCWRCDNKGNGEWKEMSLGGKNGFSLRDFMESVGYNAVTDLAPYKSGEQVATALTGTQGFEEFKTASADSFTTFLKNINSNHSSALTTDLSTKTDTLKKHSLAALFLCATSYFQHHRSLKSDHSPRPPSTIRSMLYWLSCLAVTPQFGDLLDRFNDVVGSDFQVTVSGSHKQNEKLSPDNLVGHLISSCLSSSWVLGTIQGPGETEDPLLPNIYCSSELSYPSSFPTLFSTLSNCTYALQFQLHFLYQQCRLKYSLGSGWRGCQFGKSTNPQGTTVESHICSAGCNKSHLNGDHSSNPKCKHNDCVVSPLHAFLTDNLKGFSLPTETNKIKYFDGHMAQHPAGSMCHVKMGFTYFTQEKKKGSDIYNVLKVLCSGAGAPLSEIAAKLSCLTKRTPKNMGDVFGFIWHLTGQLFKNVKTVDQLKSALSANHNSVEDFIAKLTKSMAPPKPQPEQTGIIKSLQTMAPSIPFLYQLFRVNKDDFLPVTLFNVVQHCHKVDTQSGHDFKILHEASSNSVVTSGHNCSQNPNDLWSLCQPVGPAPGGGEDAHAACRGTNCGGYLYSLTHSYGSTYAPSYASAYLSWVSYLVDDLHEWLGEMRDDVNNISCKHCNITYSCFKGIVGASQCQCPSVVSCSGVLPVLYSHGFQFYSPHSLSGGNDSNRKTKRNCKQFSQQLSNVLAENAPLAKLLESIDNFLYLFRFYFFYNLSSFWLCSLAILLYFIFYGIDVLHFKSHVHFPSSHTVPPIGLLTTGKAPALTKLTYYMP
ncbi:variant erythrocyte surface antigen-1 family protein [Babesia caballi]|uniref:Variant erythrocyte surface antigen-1 family protein n=1 Tax=Babesia caballi TaxID=5871 RepID=A0AAV4LXW3_BABCB|nr:variant erythrocyte surface antigen-1 family protein [Babesia caballi]